MADGNMKRQLAIRLLLYKCSYFAFYSVCGTSYHFTLLNAVRGKINNFFGYGVSFYRMNFLVMVKNNATPVKNKAWRVQI